MKTARIASIALAGGIALAVPFLVSAESPTETHDDGWRMRGQMMKAHARHMGESHDGHRGQRGHRADGDGHGMGAGQAMGAGFLRGLELSEEQRDRIFAIRHASQPAMREQAKILRDARAEFGKLALSNEYDEAKVREFAERNAQAISTMAQLRARSMNEIYRVLTPEQQTKVAERQARWEQRGARGEGSGLRGEGRRGAPAMPAQPGTPRS